MFFPFRNGPAKTIPTHPLFAGLVLAADESRLESAVIGLAGCRAGTPVELCAAHTFELTSTQTESVSSKEPKEGFSANHRFDLIARDALSCLLNADTVAPHSLVLAAVSSRSSLFQFHTFGLAQRTGVTLLDGLEQNDGLRLGHGSPFQTFLYWILLSQTDRPSLVVDLGRSVHLSLLPEADSAREFHLQAADEGLPCGLLLDLLTLRVTNGRQTVDDSGRLSVQGRNIPEVTSLLKQTLREWSVESKPKSVLPEYKVPQAMAEYLLQRLDADARRSQWSNLDILCTAVGWIAEEVIQRIRALYSRSTTMKIILRGQTVKNALLRCRLSRFFTQEQVRTLADFGFPDNSFDAVTVALWSALTAWRIPEQYSVWHERVGGFPRPRLTPGSQQSWSTFLQFQQKYAGDFLNQDK